MSVSKYISTRFSSVLSGESYLGRCRLMGCWEWEVLWSAPVPSFLGEGHLFHVCSAMMLSSGAPLGPVQSHPQSMCCYLPSPGFPAPSFYFHAS